mgnify:CR=1 FL=1
MVQGVKIDGGCIVDTNPATGALYYERLGYHNSQTGLDTMWFDALLEQARAKT